VVLSIIVLIGFTIYDLQIGTISNSRIIMNSFFKAFFIGGTGLVSGYTGKRAKKIIIQNYMEQAEKDFITKIFGKYVSGPVADKILSGSFELGGEERKITVLFSDIRNFTPICEKMSPKDVVHFLNNYFNMMANIIFKHGGTINKFTGDGFMAIFGAPISHENNEERAISAALEMRVKLKEFNKAQMQNRHKLKISAGVGISTGTATVGNIGSQDRMEYTAIGDTVNTASRIENLCKKFDTDILLDDKTYKPIKNLFVIKKKGPVKVKGKEKPINICELIKPRLRRRLPHTFNNLRGKQ
jgi:adenylate cyclase